MPMMARPRIQWNARDTMPQLAVVLENMTNPCDALHRRKGHDFATWTRHDGSIHNESVWNRSRRHKVGALGGSARPLRPGVPAESAQETLKKPLGNWIAIGSPDVAALHHPCLRHRARRPHRAAGDRQDAP